MPTVDHNYGGADALAYKTAAGQGVDKAEIKIYRRADWVAGNRSSRFLAGRTGTGDGGRWLAPLELPAGEYVLVFVRHQRYGPNYHELTVAV